MGANNMAATREALEAIKCIDTRGLKRLLYELVEADIFDGGLINKTISAVEKAMSVLSKTPRNCDVGTAEERMYRYNRLRDEINERYKRLGEIPPSFAFPTAFEWEDSPYEADEGTGK